MNFVFGVLPVLVFAVVIYFALRFLFGIVRPWIRLKFAGGKGSLTQIVAMQFRGLPVSTIVEAYLILLYRGESVSLSQLELLTIAHPLQVNSSQDLVELVQRNRTRSPSD